MSFQVVLATVYQYIESASQRHSCISLPKWPSPTMLYTVSKQADVRTEVLSQPFVTQTMS